MPRIARDGCWPPTGGRPNWSASRYQRPSRTDREFLDDPSQAAAVEVNDRRIMAENDVEALEEKVSLPDGTCATWLSTKASSRDADGIVVGLVRSLIDISERKRAEDALMHLNEALEDEDVERTAERDRM